MIKKLDLLKTKIYDSNLEPAVIYEALMEFLLKTSYLNDLNAERFKLNNVNNIYVGINYRYDDLCDYVLSKKYDSRDINKIVNLLTSITNYIYWGGNNELSYVGDKHIIFMPKLETHPNIVTHLGIEERNNLVSMHLRKKYISEKILIFLLNNNEFEAFINYYNLNAVFLNSRSIFSILNNHIKLITDFDVYENYNMIFNNWSYTFTSFIKQELSKELYLELEESKEKLLVIHSILYELASYFIDNKDNLYSLELNDYQEKQLDNLYLNIDNFSKKDSFLNYNFLYISLNEILDNWIKYKINVEIVARFYAFKTEFSRLFEINLNLDLENTITFKDYLTSFNTQRKHYVDLLQNRIDQFYDNQLTASIKSLYKEFTDDELESYCTNFFKRNVSSIKNDSHNFTDERISYLYTKIKGNKELCIILAYGEKIFENYDTIDDLNGGDFTSLVVTQIKSFERYLKEVIISGAKKNNKKELYFDMKNSGRGHHLSFKPNVRKNRKEYKFENKILVSNLKSADNLSKYEQIKNTKEYSSISIDIGKMIEFIYNEYNIYAPNKNINNSIFKPRKPREPREPINPTTSILYREWVKNIRNGYMHIHRIETLSRAKEINNNTAYWLLRAIEELIRL